MWLAQQSSEEGDFRSRYRVSFGYEGPFDMADFGKSQDEFQLGFVRASNYFVDNKTIKWDQPEI